MPRVVFHARFTWTFLVAGLVGMVLVFAVTRSSFGFAPVILVALGILHLMIPLLVLEADHFSWRPGPIVSPRQIRYREIRRMDLQGSKLFVTAGDEACVIDLKHFAAPARAQIIRELEQRTE